MKNKGNKPKSQIKTKLPCVISVRLPFTMQALLRLCKHFSGPNGLWNWKLCHLSKKQASSFPKPTESPEENTLKLRRALNLFTKQDVFSGDLVVYLCVLRWKYFRIKPI